MGAGRTLRRAIADLRALPRDAAERRLAFPILVRLRFEIPADPAKQTTIDREFLMTTQEIDKYLEQLSQDGRKKGRAEGRAEGFDLGFARAVLAAYRARFGAPPAALVARVNQAGDHDALQRWLVVVTTGTAEEIAATLRPPATRKKPSGTTGRRRASPRRAEASRR